MNTTMTNAPETSVSRVEVITSVQRRRRWSAAETIRLFEETSQPGMSVSFVARRAGIAPSQLFAWKRRMAEGGQVAVAADQDVVGASQVVERGRFPMSAVAQTLGVARANLAERKKGMTKPRARYRKAEDAELTPLIRAIVDERPTYGYRRVCALANRKLRAEGKPPVNAKRVLRIMQNGGLTL
jgi:transposase-like protein